MTDRHCGDVMPGLSLELTGEVETHAITLLTPVVDGSVQPTAMEPFNVDPVGAGEEGRVTVGFGTLVAAPLGGQTNIAKTTAMDIKTAARRWNFAFARKFSNGDWCSIEKLMVFILQQGGQFIRTTATNTQTSAGQPIHCD